MLSDSAKQKMYESQRRIHKETLERIEITVKKGYKAKYQALASSRGVSLTKLIVSLLDDELKK